MKVRPNHERPSWWLSSVASGGLVPVQLMTSVLLVSRYCGRFSSACLRHECTCLLINVVVVVVTVSWNAWFGPFDKTSEQDDKTILNRARHIKKRTRWVEKLPGDIVGPVASTSLTRQLICQFQILVSQITSNWMAAFQLVIGASSSSSRLPSPSSL